MSLIKIIHYCWFGYGKKSELIEKCISSWKKYCPDYVFYEWNEDNFNIHCCKYVEQAYNKKKWAFVSDYCRFWALKKYGGVYLDTDVELLRPLDNLPVNFVGFESKQLVNSGLIRGAHPDSILLDLILESYENDSFLNSDGTLNLETVCERETKILIQMGLVPNNKKQIVGDTTIFPSSYFSPFDYSTNKTNITDHTYSIHWYGGSWHNEQDNYKNSIRLKLVKFFPPRLASILAFIISKIKFDGLIGLIKYCTHKF